MVGPRPLSFDVTAAHPADVCDGRSLTIAGWFFFPDDPALLGRRPVTMTLLAGGSYDKRYNHATIADCPGYSAAEHLAALGSIVLLLDHLGVGEAAGFPSNDKRRAALSLWPRMLRSISSMRDWRKAICTRTCRRWQMLRGSGAATRWAG